MDVRRQTRPLRWRTGESVGAGANASAGTGIDGCTRGRGMHQVGSMVRGAGHRGSSGRCGGSREARVSDDVGGTAGDGRSLDRCTQGRLHWHSGDGVR